MIPDGVTPDIFSEGPRRARKTHACQECRSAIVPGEVYQRREGRCDGYWFSDALCAACHEWSEAYSEAQRQICGQVYGWTVGSLWEEIGDFIEEHHGYARKVSRQGHVLMEAVVAASTLDA